MFGISGNDELSSVLTAVLLGGALLFAILALVATLAGGSDWRDRTEGFSLANANIATTSPSATATLPSAAEPRAQSRNSDRG